jgi:ankyrin repeat-rich membrane spanning protein
MTVDEDGNNPLHFAALCSRDTSEVVDFLFQQTNGMDVNKNKLIDSRNVDEETPLIRAATKGNLSMIKCLIRNGADIGAMDANKNTVIANLARNGHLWALHFVLSLCPPHVARTLLSQADVDNHTALDWACYKGHTNVAEYLMYRGIEPTSVDTNGRNCLHWAAKEGMAETASYLVAIGMDPLAKDNDGNSPAMFALTNWEVRHATIAATTRTPPKLTPPLSSTRR